MIKVILVQLVHKARLAQLVLKERLVQQVLPVLKVRLGPQAILEHKVKPVLKATKVTLVLTVKMV